MTNGYVIIDFGGKTIDDTGFNDPSVYAKIVNTNKPVMITNAKVTVSSNNLLDLAPSFVTTVIDKDNEIIYISMFEQIIAIEKSGSIYSDIFAG